MIPLYLILPPLVSTLSSNVLATPTFSCSGLSAAALGDHITISSTSDVAKGTLNITGAGGTNSLRLCRIEASLQYGASMNNTLTFEIWLPYGKNWNNRYMAVGNGGFAGSIDYAALTTRVNQGYAVAGGDGGYNLSATTGNYVSFFHNVDQTRSWIQNSISYFTPPARNLTEMYYSSSIDYSYYAGCSTGGAQGFAIAQYHPDLFDGIYAGSPGNWYSHLMLSFLWNGLKTQGAGYMPSASLRLIQNAVNKACDSVDGVTDGLIENPLRCQFDITSLQCANGQSPTSGNATVCLTAAQVVAAQAAYAGPTDLRTGGQLYPGFSVGSEVNWGYQESILYSYYAVPLLRNLVYNNITWDYTTFNFGSDADYVTQIASMNIDEIAVDLSAYRARGGKLMAVQGCSDPFNAATWPIQHREATQYRLGGDVSDFYELYMVPGGGHCGGGLPSSPNTYHFEDVLMPWVEKNNKPGGMQSSGPSDGSNSTRKLCPWPKNAVFTGKDETDWKNYSCNVVDCIA